MFRILFDLPRSLICIKALLLLINPLKDIKECTYKRLNKRDLLALYLRGTYCLITSTRPPSCATPRQPIMYISNSVLRVVVFMKILLVPIRNANKILKSYENEIKVN